MSKLLLENWHAWFQKNRAHIVNYCMGLEVVFAGLFWLLYIQPFIGMAGDLGGFVPYVCSLLLVYAERQWGVIPWSFFERLPLHWHTILLSLLIGAGLISQYTLRPIIIFLRKNGATN